MNNYYNTVNVSAAPRLHLGLLDCGYATKRLYGGLGVSVDGLPTEVSAQPSDSWNVSFNNELASSNRTIQDVHVLIDRLKQVIEPSSLYIDHAAPEHMGLGSKTTLLLATTVAAFIARNQSLFKEQIVSLTQRGGASGIGVNLFWEGGMIVDAGHKVELEERNFQPSSARKASTIPPVISRIEMPSNWKVQLCYDPQFDLIEGVREVEIFRNAMPIEKNQCLTSLSLVYHGILPSILEKDLQTLSSSLEEMNNVGMKAVEVQCQTPNTQKFLKSMWSMNVPTGLSSFGPCVYVITEEDDDGNEKITEQLLENGLQSLGTFEFKNKGFSIQSTNNA